MMFDERRQFAILFRHFLARVIDLEILSASGDLQKLLAQVLAVLTAFGFVVTIVVAPRLAFSTLPPEAIAKGLAAQADFMIAATMAVAGAVVLLAWNVVLPDRRDSSIIGLLPVRARTILLAKAAALVSAAGLGVLAINIVMGLAFPLLAPPGLDGRITSLRLFGAYWITIICAGWFVVAGCVAVQAAAALSLGYRRFQRLSSVLQFAGFFVIAGLCLFKPTLGIVPWVPSSWFLELYQQLSTAHPALSGRALESIVIVTALALLTFPIAFRRILTRVIEQPEILPQSGPGALASACSFLLRHAVPDPLHRAILMFVARTVARSRQHRLVLAAYGGVGLSFAILYLQDLFRGVYTSALWDFIGGVPARVRWDQPSAPLLAASIILLVFAVTGLRAVVPLPLTLQANWIFRVTAVHAPAAYFFAVRRCLYAFSVVPVVVVCGVVLLVIWPAAAAVQHLAVLLMVGVVLVENSLRNFPKIPFACSYLPGKGNWNIRLAAYALLFFFFVDRGIAVEFWAIEDPRRYAVLLTLLTAAAAWSRHRTSRTGAGLSELMFEDAAPPLVTSLNLRSDTPIPVPTSALTSEDELDEELRCHLRMAALDHEAQGESPAAARFHALRDLGNLTRIKEDVREAWKANSWDLLLQDVRLALRGLKRAPLFGATVIAMIALGIGVNASVFLLFYGVIHRPLHGIAAPGLVSLGVAMDGREDDPGNSWLNYVSYVESAKTLRNLVARGFGRFTVGFANNSVAVRGGLVTANYFEALGVRLPLGRSFSAQESDLNSDGLAVVISHRLWQDEFAGARNILGRVLTLNGQPATVIGVAPPGFRGVQIAERMDVWTPILAYSRLSGEDRRLQDRGFRFVELFGQLAPHADLADAQAELDVISQRLAGQYEENRRLRALVAPHTAIGPGVQLARLVFKLLLVVGGLLLLVACANVANLMLSRSLLRQHEMAVRKSLGAPFSRILGLLLMEGLILSVLAAAAGWILAAWTTPALLRSLAPPGTLPSLNLSPDAVTLLYAFLQVCMVTAVFTVLPGLAVWRQEPLSSLRSRQVAASPVGKRMLAASTLLQLTASTVLLIGAGLLLRTSAKLSGFDAGFPKQGLLFLTVDTAGAAATPASGAMLLDDLAARLRAIPGITNVSYAAYAPLGWQSISLGRIGGEGSTVETRADSNVVGPQYLTTLGATIRFGRDITRAHTIAGPRVAVVTESVARLLWPAQNPVGQRIVRESGAPVEIIGVVADGAFGDLRRGAGQKMVFLPFAQQPQRPGAVTLHIRHAGGFAALMPAIRAAVHGVHSQVPIVAVASAEQHLQDAMPLRFLSTLIALFAGGALLVAGVGLYGLIALSMTARAREFALRIALGATPGSVWRIALGRGMTMTGIGLASGILVSAAAGRTLRSLLFGVGPNDPITYGVVAGLLVVTGLAAALLPARGATQLDPIRILREE